MASNSFLSLHLDGTTLEDMSHKSTASSVHIPTTHATGRPFVIPVFDPEESNEDSFSRDVPRRDFPCVYRSYFVKGSQPKFLYRRDSHWTVKVQGNFNFQERQQKQRYLSNDSMRSLLEHDQPRNEKYRMSITPNEVPIPEIARYNTAMWEGKHDNSYAECNVGPPDEGRLAWLHVLAGFLVIMNAQGLNMSFGIFQAYYEKVMLAGTSSSKIAWIGSIQVFFLFFLSLLVAPAIDNGYFRLCFHGGSLLLLLATFATSYCTTWWQLFLIQGLISGIAMGSVFASGLMVLLTYFSKHLGIATGIAAAGAPVGGIIFPLVARSAIGTHGFGWTVRIFALINFLTMVVANLVVRPRPTTLKDSPKDGQGKRQRADKAFMLMAAGMFFTYWGFYIAFYYIVLYGQDVLHLNDSSAVNLLIAMNASAFAGRFAPNFISDACLGPLNTITPWTLVTAMLAFCWIAATNSSGLFLVSCLYGFTSAAVPSLYTSTIFSFTSRGSAEAAKQIGLVLAVIGVAVLTGAPIGGALIVRSSGGYLHTQMFAGITLGIGGMFFLAARIARSGLSPDKV